MSPAGILAQLDKEEASFRTSDAVARLTTLNAAPALLAGTADLAFILTLGAAVQAQPGLAAVDLLNKNIYSGFFKALDDYFAANTATPTLNAYATAQNAGTLDSFLIGPNCAHLYWLFKQSSAAWLLSPGNVFAPVTTFGAATVGASAALTYTAGAAPNTIPVVNGLNSQGYTASKGLTALVTTTIGGTLTVTVTANGRNAAGYAVTGRTWTGVLDAAVGGSGAIAFTPGVTGDRISAITAVTGAGTAGSGAFSLQSVIERIAV